MACSHSPIIQHVSEKATNIRYTQICGVILFMPDKILKCNTCLMCYGPMSKQDTYTTLSLSSRSHRQNKSGCSYASWFEHGGPARNANQCTHLPLKPHHLQMSYSNLLKSGKKEGDTTNSKVTLANGTYSVRRLIDWMRERRGWSSAWFSGIFLVCFTRCQRSNRSVLFY